MVRGGLWAIGLGALLWAWPVVAQETNGATDPGTNREPGADSAPAQGDDANNSSGDTNEAEGGQASEGSQPAVHEAPDQGDIEEARLLFLAAQRAFGDGRYEDAITSFQRSYSLTDDPQLLYNLAVVRDRLHRDEEAIETFRTYLELQPATPDRAEIEARIAAIERRIADREVVAAEAAEPAPMIMHEAVPADSAPNDDGPAVWSRWWFWTAVVAVVAVGVVAGVAVAAANGSSDPAPGSEGVVIEALTWR